MNVSSAAISAQKLEKQQELDDLRARLAETEEDMAQLIEVEEQLQSHSVVVNVPDITVPPAEVVVNVPPQPTQMMIELSDNTISRLVTALAGIQSNSITFSATDELKDVLRQIIVHENIQVPGLLDTVNSLE